MSSTSLDHQDMPRSRFGHFMLLLHRSSYFHEEWITFCVAIDLLHSSTQSIIGMHVAHQILLKMIEKNCSALDVNNAIGEYEGDLSENELSGLFM